MLDVAVIDNPAAAEAALDPVRARMLARLAEPQSAAMLARALGMPRQKVNYHLRTLEHQGLAELVEERRRGNVSERLLRATAASYVISPAALAAVAPDPARSPDQLSARWLLALAAQLVRDVGELISGAAAARKRVSTLALDANVRFASAADRSAFARDLAEAVTALVAKYHDEAAEGGREHRVVVGVHPRITRGTGSAGTGSAGQESAGPGSAGPGSAGQESAGSWSAGSGSAGSGSAGFSPGDAGPDEVGDA